MDSLQRRRARQYHWVALFHEQGDLYDQAWLHQEEGQIRDECEALGLPMGYGRVRERPVHLSSDLSDLPDAVILECPEPDPAKIRPFRPFRPLAPVRPLRPLPPARPRPFVPRPPVPPSFASQPPAADRLIPPAPHAGSSAPVLHPDVVRELLLKADAAPSERPPPHPMPKREALEIDRVRSGKTKKRSQLSRARLAKKKVAGRTGTDAAPREAKPPPPLESDDALETRFRILVFRIGFDAATLELNRMRQEAQRVLASIEG